MTNRVTAQGDEFDRTKHFRLPKGSATLGLAVVALLAISGIAAACGGGGGGGGGQGGGLTTTCSSAGAVDALQIPLGVPQTSATAGSYLNVSYEVEILGFTSADIGALIHFPSVYVKIPLTATTKFSTYFFPTNITVAGAGWSAPVTKEGILSSATNFDGGAGIATLSTVSIAVMAKDTVGNLTIGVQWGWDLTVSGVITSSWSTPSATATLPTLPSIFQAAPWVGVVATTNTTAAPSGSDFEAQLSGAVGKTSFGVSVEYPNGTEVVCKEQTNWKHTSCLIVDVPLTYVNSTGLLPGNYIVHIHDSVGAIVHTISVTVVASSGGHHHHGGSGGLSCSCSGKGGGQGQGGGQGGGGGCGGGSQSAAAYGFRGASRPA